ncbi:MAG: hypothetical protein K1Y02_25495 [Candidatus Hydrogenedentes bacterium]|nr:hypothetical protein [Candidatus Hydrogenedentota bacterium]
MTNSHKKQPIPGNRIRKYVTPYYRRRLPHIQNPERPFFVTFVTYQRWSMPEPVRDLALKHCLHDHNVKILLHAAVIMPDHVDLIFTPLQDDEGMPYSLEEILNGIKGASAHSIYRFLKRRGHVWQDESMDHVLRVAESVRAKAEYICDNPVRRGLVQTADEYPWLWREWVEGID